MLVLSRFLNDQILIGPLDRPIAVVQLAAIDSFTKAKIGIEAHKGIQIIRAELAPRNRKLLAQAPDSRELIVLYAQREELYDKLAAVESAITNIERPIIRGAA